MSSTKASGGCQIGKNDRRNDIMVQIQNIVTPARTDFFWDWIRLDTMIKPKTATRICSSNQIKFEEHVRAGVICLDLQSP